MEQNQRSVDKTAETQDKKVLTNRMIVIFYSIPIYIGMGNMAYRGN